MFHEAPRKSSGQRVILFRVFNVLFLSAAQNTCGRLTLTMSCTSTVINKRFFVREIKLTYLHFGGRVFGEVTLVFEWGKVTLKHGLKG